MRIDFSEDADTKERGAFDSYDYEDEDDMYSSDVESDERSDSIYSDSYNADDDDYMSDEELEKRLRQRRERYRAPDYVPPEKDTRTVNKWVVIAVIAAVFIYFIVLIVLNTVGTITSLQMLLFSLPLGAIALGLYLYLKSKGTID